MILFIIGLITYGLGRATQQASLFIARNNRIYPAWIDEPNEIHFFGWFEAIGLILSASSLIYEMLTKNNLWLILLWIPGYFIYWLPYALLFCYMRKKKWFAKGQLYRVWKIKVKLLTRTQSIIMFVISVITVLFV